MQRDFSQCFKDLDGSQIESNGKALSLRIVAISALQGVYEDEARLPADEKIKRHNLAVKIHADNVVSLTAEDVALIKQLINKAYPSPLVVAQSWAMLEAEPTVDGSCAPDPDLARAISGP